MLRTNSTVLPQEDSAAISGEVTDVVEVAECRAVQQTKVSNYLRFIRRKLFQTLPISSLEGANHCTERMRTAYTTR